MADAPIDAVDETTRRFCVLAHASGLLGLVLPFGQLLGPYLVGLLAPRHAERARDEAREALNFQLNVVAVLLLLLVLCIGLRAGWGFVLLAVPNVYGATLALVAATRASRTGRYRYPAILRPIR